MTLAMGLAGGAAIGAASLMGQLGSNTKGAEITIDRTQFASALGVYLNSSYGCDELKIAGASGLTETPSPFKISKWKFNGIGTFETGTDVKSFKIKDLSTNLMKPSTPTLPIKIVKNGVLYQLTKAIVRVNATLSMRERNGEIISSDKRWQDYTQAYDMAVLVTDTNTIQFCNGSTTISDTCSALSGQFDVDTEQCSLDKSCYTFGSYITLNCNPLVDGTCDTSRGTDQVNTVTGTTSCPPGTSAIPTGIDTWTKNIDCGKKCQVDQNNSIGYYSCVQCD